MGNDVEEMFCYILINIFLYKEHVIIEFDFFYFKNGLIRLCFDLYS